VNVTLDYFDYQSDFYDVYQVHCVPRYHEMTAMATGFLREALTAGTSRPQQSEPNWLESPWPESIAASPRILDLGCGTGNTSLTMSRLFPGAHITALDGSEGMIARAKDKLAAVGTGNADFRVADLSRPGWSGALADQPFHAAVSVLVLEHLPFDAYRTCLSETMKLLEPGGWLITVEGYEAPLGIELFYREMARLELQAVKEGRITRARLDEMKALSAANEKHYFSSMSQRQEWWLEAGYSPVEFIWQYYCVAVLVGRKPLY
jgi:tRNA (cmo5U34)-methyltransferase